MIPIYQENQVTEIFSRQDPVNDAAQEVRAILEQVKTRGDAALKEYTKTFDGAELSTIEVDAWTVDEGFRRADPVLVEILYRAAERISAFHQNQLRSGFQTSGERGIILGQKVLPLERVGLYVPGGTAAYPSSVLMNAIPAKLAGCGEVVMASPPAWPGSPM